MAIEQFQWNASTKGLRVVDNVAMGEYNGRYCVYPFSITGNGKEANNLMMDIRVEQTIKGPLFKEMKKQIKQFGSLLGAPVNAVRFVPDNKNPDPFGACLYALNILIPMLEANGITSPSTCPYCKNGMMDSEAFVNGFYVPVHRYCVENEAQKGLQKIHDNENEGSSRILGIVGAILGAIVGSIPALLLLMFANRLSAWLYALIPLGSYYGYKLLKGKMDKAVLPIVIICTLLSTVFAELVQFYYALHQYTSTWPPLGQAIAYYFEIMSAGDILGDLALPLVFCGLGIFVSWSVIRQTNATMQKGIDFTLRTLFVKNQQ